MSYHTAFQEALTQPATKTWLMMNGRRVKALTRGESLLEDQLAAAAKV
jgi:hypothetical protein